MENRTHAIIAVSFLVVFSLGAVLVYYWLSNQQNEPLVYEIVTGQSVGGLSVQSKVQFKGIDVGHVTKLGFDPKDRAKVVMQLNLEPKTYVTHATYAEIAMQGLTGGSVLELKLGKGSNAPLATSAGHPARIPMREGLIGSLMSSARADMQQIHELLASANKVLDTSNRQHIAASLQQIDTVTRQLATIEAQLPALLKNVQRSVDESHALLADADRTVRDAQPAVRKAAALEASIEAVARSSRQLSERLNRQTAPDFDSLSQSLQRTSEQLDQLLRELKAKPQSLIFGPPTQSPGPGEPGFDKNGFDKQHKEPHQP